MMATKNDTTTPAEKIALWADKLRDLSAAGLEYATNAYDQTSYEAIQQMAMEMLAYATEQPLEALIALKSPIFARMSPVVAGAAAVIDRDGRILLMRRTDNGLWSMPAGQMEVGETPAEAVIRETLEETGVRCVQKALVGVYDSRVWDKGAARHVYKFTFLCEPLEIQGSEPFDPRETLEIGWFAENELPEDLYKGPRQRILDSYKMRAGTIQAHFD